MLEEVRLDNFWWRAIVVNDLDVLCGGCSCGQLLVRRFDVMKLAIIGSGISGLMAAYRLYREHDITVFEAGDYVGGHTNTVDVDCGGESQSIDTGFIVFNNWTYPNFVRLLNELNVGWQPTKMSFSVRDDAADLEYNGHSLGTLFAQRSNLIRPQFYRMLADIVRFNRNAVQSVAECDADATVGQYLRQFGYSKLFCDHYLLPMGAAIWSCSTGTFLQFPIRFIIEFYHNHGLLSVTHRPTWRVVAGGSRSYVRAMCRGFGDRIRLRTPIRRVIRETHQVDVQPEHGASMSFDHVIFACHSDQALRILGDDATAVERDVLGAFPYGRNVAVLHTDISALPRRPQAWAAWNYRVRPDSAGHATVTYNMNILQGLSSRQTFCVTLNDEANIDPAQVLGRYVYHHPIFTTRRAAVQARHRELINVNRTSFCGAYWGSGFHEDGVNSALAVVDRLRGGAARPSHPVPALHPVGIAR